MHVLEQRLRSILECRIGSRIGELRGQHEQLVAVEERAVLATWRETCATNANSLEHTTAAKLMQNHHSFKAHCLLRSVGLDAPDVVRIGRWNCLHQLTEWLFELCRHREQFERWAALVAAHEIWNWLQQATRAWRRREHFFHERIRATLHHRHLFGNDKVLVLVEKTLRVVRHFAGIVHDRKAVSAELWFLEVLFVLQMMSVEFTIIKLALHIQRMYYLLYKCVVSGTRESALFIQEVDNAELLFNQIETALIVFEFNVRPVNLFFGVLLLFNFENVLIRWLVLCVA